MKVTGFSFIRNAIQYDYPIVEAINSVLPVCDEFIIAVGKSEDNTLALIKNIDSPKIKIIETVWNTSIKTRGAVLAQETDKAFRAVSEDSDWAFYIQGDEILHEQYYDTIQREMLQWKDTPEVDGLLFHYKHFYGSYDYVAISPRWYRKEIRIIRNKKDIYSYRDAQGFRKNNDKKLNVKQIDAYIYHYGWVRHPQNMQRKIENFNGLYHNEQWIRNHIPKAEEFDYSGIDVLTRFEETHPETMKDRINRTNWVFNHDLSRQQLSWKYKIKMMIEKWTGYRLFEYKNYKIIR